MNAPMNSVCCLPPVEDENARILILGSMPGTESLLAQQYYAHKRNAFWPIIGELTGTDPAASYPRRLEALKAAGIALWDVMASCDRPGSLDSAIDAASITPNDFAAFFRSHPKITRVYFNGAMAEKCYRKLVLSQARPIACLRLPSTSPANAALCYAKKLDAWRNAIAPIPD